MARRKKDLEAENEELWQKLEDSRRFLSGRLRTSFPLIARQSKAMNSSGVAIWCFGLARSHSNRETSC
jgi:hypothetical protein